MPGARNRTAVLGIACVCADDVRMWPVPCCEQMAIARALTRDGNRRRAVVARLGSAVVQLEVPAAPAGFGLQLLTGAGGCATEPEQAVDRARALAARELVRRRARSLPPRHGLSARVTPPPPNPMIS
eukprot:1210521-Rhodomonas_salina.1